MTWHGMMHHIDPLMAASSHIVSSHLISSQPGEPAHGGLSPLRRVSPVAQRALLIIARAAAAVAAGASAAAAAAAVVADDNNSNVAN